jgi:preprotein translocase subunit SecG
MESLRFMTIFLTIVHIFVCIFLVIVVLLQSGKAADLAGAFGGMGSQTAFGPRGAATVLSKATTIAAALFMMTSLSLAIMATRTAGAGGSSVLQRTTSGQKAPATTQAPATQGQPAQQQPAAAQQTPAAPAPAAGQPTVELVDQSGKVIEKRPLDLSKMPQVDPNKPVMPAEGTQKAAPANKK